MAYITHIRVDQCRNVQDLAIDLSVPAPGDEAPESSERPRAAFRHLILTGPNGSGKSGVLEALTTHIDAALYPDPEKAMRPGVTTHWIPEPPLWDISYGQRLPLGVLTAQREIGHMLSDAGTQGKMIAVYLRAQRRISHQEVAGPSKLHWEPGNLKPETKTSEQLLQFLVNKRTEQALAAEDRDPAAVERIREWFTRFEAHLRRLMEDDTLVFEFDRRAWNFRFHRADHVFDLNTLADGHAAVLMILAELLIRIDVVREARADFTFEPEGIVLIDEIETHLHLSLQEQILPFLTSIFPRFQFIVATHSPAVIASIPGAVVYDLAKKQQTLSDYFRGVRYGTLMTEHFGISSEIDLDSTEKLLRLRALTDLSSRSPEQERELGALSVVLSARSPTMAVEVWMAMEGLGKSSVEVARGKP